MEFDESVDIARFGAVDGQDPSQRWSGME